MTKPIVLVGQDVGQVNLARMREAFSEVEFRFCPTVEAFVRQAADAEVMFSKRFPPEAIDRACENYRPNLLADYLFDVAQTYSSLYQNVPFLKAEAGARESRVRLSGLAADVLRKGLELLGIETPARI